MSNTYWDSVYLEKNEEDMSWYQEHPIRSLELINELSLPKAASIIDVGGGDSKLVDHLLLEGYEDITVLDISEVSLKKLRDRVGENEKKVRYVVSDVTEFEPLRNFDLWHDRATFHFLTQFDQIEKYLRVVHSALVPEGNLIISTFSKDGPVKCSGLPIKQYSEFELKELFKKYFSNTRCFEDSHVTPLGKMQSFVYCGFKKKL